LALCVEVGKLGIAGFWRNWRSPLGEKFALAFFQFAVASWRMRLGESTD
jgi:hypothetical protein